MNNTNKVVEALNKSLIFRKINNSYEPDENSIRLTLKIIITSKQKFNEIYPLSEFHVIIWDNISTELRNRISTELTRNDIKVHLISKIITQFMNNRDLYRIHKFDDHPNALAHKEIAEYIVKMLK